MTVSVLQFVSGTDAAGVGLTAVATLTPTAGSSLHIFVSMDGAHTVSTIVSVPVETITLRDTITDTTNSQIGLDYTVDNVASGSHTITVTFNSATAAFRYIAVKEIGGTSGYDAAATAAHAGQFQPTPGTGTDGLSSGNTSTLSTQPALASGFSMDSTGGATPAAGTGFTSDGTGCLFGGATNLVRGENKRVTATTALAATYTAGINEPHITIVAVFKETAGGATQGQNGLLLSGYRNTALGALN